MGTIDTVKNLIGKALEAKLTLKELYASWEDEWDTNKFLDGVFYNLEEGVQHMPGYLIKKGVNTEKWESSSFYRELQLDLQILAEAGNKTGEELLKARELRVATEELNIRRSRRKKSL